MIENTKLAASDFNMQTLNTQMLEKHISYSIDAGSNVIITGQRGIGKTAIPKQIIRQKDMVELYINLSVFERADLLGYCDLFNNNQKDEFIDYRLPRIFQPLFRGDKKVVILFDEADKADSSLNAPLLEIVQMKSINGRKLPNLQSCILTGNLIGEGGNKLISPLLDRAEKYLLEANTDSWLKWGTRENCIHPSVFKYIQDNPNMLCGEVDLGDNYSDRSPRSWFLSSDVINYGERNNWDTDTILEKVAGFVGKQAEIDFKTYYTHYQTLLPLIDKVFNGDNIKKEYKGLEPSDKLAACIIVGSRFVGHLDKNDPKNINGDLINVVGKFLSIVEPENIIATIRSTMGLNRYAKWKMTLDKNDNWRFLESMRETVYG